MWTTDTKLGGPECGPQTLSLEALSVDRLEVSQDVGVVYYWVCSIL